MDVLVSGASSGLGKYLKEVFNADSYDRATLSAPKPSYDLIIHCAFNVTSHPLSELMPLYVEDTVGLTEWLLKIPHRQFVYISSAAVYPTDGRRYRENDIYDAGEIKDFYGMMKLTCEGIVTLRSPNPLILRAIYMLGPYIHKNCLIELMIAEKPEIVLPASSTFNYILHEDVAEFIHIAWQCKLTGIYNLAASGDTTIGKVAESLEKHVTFGNYDYKTSHMDNTKAAGLCDAFKRNSLENAMRFHSLVRNVIEGHAPGNAA